MRQDREAQELYFGHAPVPAEKGRQGSGLMSEIPLVPTSSLIFY